jgi:large subunit ribosomal protein L29
MKMEELVGKTADELKEMVGYMKKELFNLRFQKAMGELENTSRFRQLRRDIARVSTLMTQRKQSTKPSKKAA